MRSLHRRKRSAASVLRWWRVLEFRKRLSLNWFRDEGRSEEVAGDDDVEGRESSSVVMSEDGGTITTGMDDDNSLTIWRS